MGVIELEPEEILRRACLPQQAELQVRAGRELMAAGDVQPVLVEIAIAVVGVDERFVEGVDKVGAGLHGRMVQRYRDLQPVATPVGVIITVILLKPALLESEPMLEFCPRPGLP